ncbi:MAG: SPOR domain-containing protein [Candidatus Marinimicrobia bacterium]|nr:SPOR domain-containing protein [Candidatus Neomarinimicrobiota bacterium]
MNNSMKRLFMCITFFMIISCSMQNNVFVGDTVDIDDYKRPAEIVKYQWSFDTKPPTSRLDPRDFIPSNYHPNVTFIPDVAGRYIVRLTMIDHEGIVIHKNFVFTAEAQPDYLAGIEKPKQEEAKQQEPVKPVSAKPLPPKIVEVPKVVETVVIKQTTVTKTPNEWIEAPKPGQDPGEVEQTPAYSTSTETKLIKDDKIISAPPLEETQTVIPASPSVENAKYTLQVSSSTVEAYAAELRDKLIARGYDAFIETAHIEGLKRYRIRVGRFATYEEAKAGLRKMTENTEFEPWIDKLGK